MIEPVESPYLVPFDGSFRIAEARTKAKPKLDKKAAKEALKEAGEALADLQEVLYADDRCAVLLVFQAMDAAGKDSTIRAVMSGVNPAGCQVFSFKQPTHEDLDHDFLWRVSQRAPERGRIGIFNRSHYEEVLVVRVHPEYLERQRLPRRPELPALWEERYESIRDFERHLARNGTLVLKFFLHVSPEEQRQRFLKRLEKEDKHWKFAAQDLDERALWTGYMQAYEAALNATSRPWAPWYAIPADDKPNMRCLVAQTVVEAMRRLDLRYPTLDEEELGQLEALKRRLADED